MADVVYVRMSRTEKQRLEDVLRAKGNVSQNEYARQALLAAVESDRIKYSDVIARQKEIAGNG